MITYKLNRYFNKSLKGIEKDYSKGKISDKDFFIEDDEVINYLLDLENILFQIKLPKIKKINFLKNF